MLATRVLEGRERDEVVQVRTDPISVHLGGAARLEVGQVRTNEAEPEAKVAIGDPPDTGPGVVGSLVTLSLTL